MVVNGVSHYQLCNRYFDSAFPFLKKKLHFLPKKHENCMILQRSTTFYNILQRFNKISQQFYDVSTTFYNVIRNINRYILIVAHDVY